MTGTRRETDERVVAACRAACLTPSKFGHSDVGDVFVRYLQGSMTAEELANFLEVTFPDPPPTITGVPREK